MKKYLLLTFLCILCLNLIAFAAEWKLVKTDNSGNIVYIDSSNITDENNIKSFWYKVLLKNNPKYSFNTTYNSIKCSNRSYKTQENILYAKDGTATREKNNGSGEFEPIPPDTNMEALYKFVCNGNSLKNGLKRSPSLALYQISITRRIYSNLHYNNRQKTNDKVDLSLKVGANGELLESQITNSTGNSEFNTLVLSATYMSFPYAPLPKSLNLNSRIFNIEIDSNKYIY